MMVSTRPSTFKSSQPFMTILTSFRAVSTGERFRTNAAFILPVWVLHDTRHRHDYCAHITTIGEGFAWTR